MKRGFTVNIICGALFTVIGLLFTAFGVTMIVNYESLAAHGNGDVWMLPMIFTALGVTFAVLGIILLCISRHEQTNIKRLIRDNDFVMAEVICLTEDWSVRLNHRPAIRVLCEHKDAFSGRTYMFQSTPLFGPLPSVQTGDSIKVFVDRESNFRKYYVDVPGV